MELMPSSVENLYYKTFVFQIKVTNLNLKEGIPSYSLKVFHNRRGYGRTTQEKHLRGDNIYLEVQKQIWLFVVH